MKPIANRYRQRLNQIANGLAIVALGTLTVWLTLAGIGALVNFLRSL